MRLYISYLLCALNRNRMRSMDLYRDAMVNGDKQDDCVAKYPNCEYTLVEKVGKWIGN